MQALFLVIIIWTLGTDQNWNVVKEYALPVVSGDIEECIAAGEMLFMLKQAHPQIAIQASCQWHEQKEPI